MQNRGASSSRSVATTLTDTAAVATTAVNNKPSEDTSPSTHREAPRSVSRTPHRRSQSNPVNPSKPVVPALDVASSASFMGLAAAASARGRMLQRRKELDDAAEEESGTAKEGGGEKGGYAAAVTAATLYKPLDALRSFRCLILTCRTTLHHPAE